MSLPKKGSRKISVENISYLWIAKSDGKRVNLTIAPSENGQKIRANFDFDTETIGSNAFKKPFVITPYVTREVILFAKKKGYSSVGRSTVMNLGNLSKVLKLDFSGARKIKKLLQDIQDRIWTREVDCNNKQEIASIIKETKQFVEHGEWFVGFEIMISNLGEINFKAEEKELILIKEIFIKANIDWVKDWSWILDFRK